MSKKLTRRLGALVLTALLSLEAGIPGLVPEAVAAEPASHIVISEIQVGGSVADDEFVELYNPTASAIIVEGWRLSRKTATGTETNLVTSFPDQTPDLSVPAFGFFLIAPPEYDGPTPRDLAYTTTSRIAADNTVILYSDAGVTVVDKVGMGAATDREGAAAPNPPANGSLERKPASDFGGNKGNGIDTDRNLDDLVVRTTSEPQNRASPPEDPQAPEPATAVNGQDVRPDEGGAVLVTWRKSADDGGGKNSVTGYVIWRKRDADPDTAFTQIGTAKAGETSFLDQTASTTVPPTFYRYKVEALGGAYSRFSATSAPVAATDDLAPTISNPAPAVATSNRSPTLSAAWADGGTGVNTAAILVEFDRVDVTAQAGVTSTGFSLARHELSEGTHSLRVEVPDRVGNRALFAWDFIVDVTAPTSHVQALPERQTSSSFDLSIESADAHSGVESVLLFWRRDGRGSFLQFDGAFPPGAQIRFDTAQTGGDGRYEFFSITRDRAGNVEAAPTTADTTVIVDTTPPAAPEGLAATAGDSEVKLAWQAVAGAISYRIRLAPEGGAFGEPIVISGTETTVSGLRNGVRYIFRLSAVDESGLESQTSEVSATPKAAKVAVPAGPVFIEGPIGGPPPEAPKIVPEAEAAAPKPGPEILGREEGREEARPARQTATLVVGALIILAGIGLGGWLWYRAKLLERW